jgi:hypothetical protein
MFLNDGSKKLFEALKAILRGGGLAPGTRNYLAIFVVAAIVLDSFLVTVFLIVLVVVRISLHY